MPSPPGLPYVDARAEAELAVWEHGRRVGLPLTVVRPTTVYGPGAPEFLVDAIRQLRDRRLYLVDRGTHIAGLTYVGNLVEAMILAGQAPEAAGQAYNINDDSSVTWAQYYGMLASMAELPPPTVSYSRTRALMMASLWAFVNFTRTGTAMRAVSLDHDTSRLMGIDVNRIITVVFLIGPGLGAVAGILVALYYGSFDFTMGMTFGLKAFIAAILGGIGNIPGAMLGGMILGIVESLGAGYISPQWKDVIAYVLLALTLIVRPTGLLGERVAEKL